MTKQIVVELDGDAQHYEVIAEEYKIQVHHLDDDDNDGLHPCGFNNDGQLNTQPAYIELDTTTPMMRLPPITAARSAVWGRKTFWNGPKRRYSISPHLTMVEINALLDEVAAVLGRKPRR